MKNNSILQLKGKLKNIFLLLISVYFPLLKLYGDNINELTLPELWTTFLIITITFSLILLILARKINKIQYIIYIIFLFNLLSSLYGSTVQFLEKYVGQLPFYRELQIIPGFLIIYYFLIKKFRTYVYRFSTILVLIIFFTFLVKIIPSFSRHQTTINPKTILDSKQEKPNGLNVNPDIYYFILDEFASSKTISKYYQYDNSKFEKQLMDIGFNIYPNSISSYSSTWPNLASILNQKLVDPKTPTKEMYPMILNGQVIIKLKKMGYKYIHISDQQLYNGSYQNPYSDYSLYDYNKNSPFNEPLFNKFATMYIKTSFLKPLISNKNNNIIRENELLKHIMLKNINLKISSPKFVFLHSMITHTPFLFNRDGYSVEYENQLNWENNEIYLETYQFSEKTILNDVENILSNNNNVIIIIQSDHGPRYEKLGDEWKSIFNAIYFSSNVNGKVIEENFINTDTFTYIFKRLNI